METTSVLGVHAGYNSLRHCSGFHGEAQATSLAPTGFSMQKPITHRDTATSAF